MYKQRISLFLFLFCVCTVSRYFSQITANTPTIGGCAPFAVTYTAPAGATSCSWNFGNGVTATSLSGGFNYTNPGTYTITYSGTGGSPTAFTVVAYVLAAPAANFNINQSLTVNCAVKTVTLTDASTGPSINQWVWAYGDGGSTTYTTGGTHTYGYTLPGTYSITLQVYNIYGCTSQITIGTVSVTASPTAAISSNPSNLFSCNPPFTAAFSGSSSTGTNLAYAWNFGNSQTSNVVTPGNITYTAQGNYTVSLTVTAGGCSSTATRVVVVSPTTITATVPSTICLNAPYTVTVQSNQPVSTWSLGGGVVANAPGSGMFNTLPTYSTTGIHTMTISAGAPPCLASLTRTVFVDQVVANFTVPPPAYSCSSPFIVTYNNLSTPNATQFSWWYVDWQGDTIVTTGANPTFTFTQNSLNPYVIYKAFHPVVHMTAISAAGCRSDTVHALDSIARPTAWFYKSQQEGCVPLVVTLTDTSFAFPFDPITSYTWCNGALPPVNVIGTGSNIPSQTFTYSAGTYSPYLVIQTAGGCQDVSFTETVIAVNPPVINFSVSPTGSICPTQTVQITNLTAMPTLTQVSHWHVDSDDGFFSGCISDPNPTWNFTHIGQHTLTMTGYVHECPGVAAVTPTLFVLGPIVQGRYTTNCTNRLSVDFNSDLQGVTNATLDFGDGTPVYTFTGNPTASAADFTTHVYGATGDYTATLTGVNPATGCPASIYTMQVTVRNVHAVVSSPSVSCINVGTVFDGSASVDVFKGCSRGYVWYVDNFPPVDKTDSTHGPIFTSIGIHTVTLMIKDLNGCTDDTTMTVRISSVTPAFAFITPSICVNTSAQLVNTSTSAPPDVISSYFWNFGDGQTGAGATPSHTYNFANTPFTIYNVTLTVTNDKGCQQSVVHPLTVVKPDPSFFPSQFNICLGPTTVTFTGAGSNIANYTLNVGQANPVTSTSSIIPYSFTTAGLYAVTMTVKDLTGCLATSGPINIQAQQTPTANFIFSSPKSTTNGNVICSPATVSFTDASQPPQPYTYSWNLGTGSSVVSQSVVTGAYSSPTTTVITISLGVSTSNFCQSTETKTFTIYAPKAKIELSKTTVCLGDPITFSIIDTTGSGIKGWVWDYGDASASGGTIIAASAPPASTLHAYSSYPSSGTASVSLIYYSSQFACYNSDTAFVTVIKVDANFNRNNEVALQDTVHCVNLEDSFYNASPGATGPTVSWSFGDGGTSSQQNPNYTYALPGIYQVSLTVTGNQSCKGIATKNMTINPLPLAHIVGPDSVCSNAPFDLAGSGTSTTGITGYQWQPVNSVSSPSSALTNVTASVSTSYSLTVTDGNGCVSPPVVKSIFAQPPPPTVQWDTTVIVGQPIPLNTKTGSNFSYTWTPVSDLSCLNCIYPVSSSTVNITYTVQVEDNLGCFRVTSTFTVNIDPQTSVDVPTAFTPNGDGVNDVIYVDGWGIKKLNYFRIFNRWGQLLFESSDIKTGWDGVYNGVPQNMETYVYQVSVETYLDSKPVLKTSSFRLIR